MKTKLIITSLLLISMHFFAQNKIAVGSLLQTVTLKDGNDIDKKIPFIGEKLVTVFYTDPDVKDVNDPLSNAIKERKYSATKYQGIGVGNCADTWIPNAAIRMKSREKEAQFKGSIILLDTDHILKKAWGFKETNETAIVVIIGIDKKVKFVSYVKTPEESKAIINEVLKVMDEELKK